MSDGQYQGQVEFKNILKECYLISKNLHTAYTDVLQISPTERTYLIQFLNEDAKEQEERLKKARAEREANR